MQGKNWAKQGRWSLSLMGVGRRGGGVEGGVCAQEMLWCGKTAVEEEKKNPLKVSECEQIRDEDNSVPSDSIRRQKER